MQKLSKITLKHEANTQCKNKYKKSKKNLKKMKTSLRNLRISHVKNETKNIKPHVITQIKQV